MLKHPDSILRGSIIGGIAAFEHHLKTLDQEGTRFHHSSHLSVR